MTKRYTLIKTAYCSLLVHCGSFSYDAPWHEGQNRMQNVTKLFQSGFIDTSHRIMEALTDDKYNDLFHNDALINFYEASSGLKSSEANTKNISGRSLNKNGGFFNEGNPETHSKDNCYLIKLKGNINSTEILDRLEELLQLSGLHHMRGFTLGKDVAGYKICFSANELPLKLLKAIKHIDHLERDMKIRGSAIQRQAPWGLASLTSSYTKSESSLKGSYLFDSTGKGVTVYLVDSGVAYNHPEFSGRAKIGFDMGYSEDFGGDCAGHGTEVASVLIGKNIGVAKEAELVAVSVLDCAGEGTNSDIVFAIDWILKNKRSPSVINMSVGGEKSVMVDAAVREAVRQGITVVVAAGNSNVDACTQSPSGVEAAIVVGAVTKSNRKADFSNYGKCVHLFAPGQQIVVANPRSKSDKEIKKDAFAISSGTSLASPFVAGIVALLLEKEPTLRPADIKRRLQELAWHGQLQGALYGSPNLLAQAAVQLNKETDIPASDLELLSPGDWPDQSGMSAVAIVLMSVGIAAALVILIAVWIFYQRKRARRF